MQSTVPELKGAWRRPPSSHAMLKEAMGVLEDSPADGFALLPLGWPVEGGRSWNFVTLVAGAEARMSPYRAAAVLAAAVRGFLVRRRLALGKPATAPGW